MLAEYLIETYTHGMRQVMGVGAAASRWITTSLLAVNGGAAIAVLGQPMTVNGKLLTSLFFAAGVLSSLGSAHLGIKAGQKLLGPMGEAMGYWVSVKHDGIRAANLEGHEIRMAEMIKNEARMPARLGYLSVACFTAGLIAAAASIARLL